METLGLPSWLKDGQVRKITLLVSDSTGPDLYHASCLLCKRDVVQLRGQCTPQTVQGDLNFRVSLTPYFAFFFLFVSCLYPPLVLHFSHGRKGSIPPPPPSLSHFLLWQVTCWPPPLAGSLGPPPSWYLLRWVLTLHSSPRPGSPQPDLWTRLLLV